MNKLFFDFFNDFCQTYLNDIFIYNKSREKHEKHLKQIFVKLEKIELQIDINKCVFFQKKKISRNHFFYKKLSYEFRQISNHCRLITIYLHQKTSKFLLIFAILFKIVKSFI